MKRGVFAIIGACFLFGFLAGCAGTRKVEKATVNHLDVLNKKKNELIGKGYFAAVATEVSKDLQVAIDKAAFAARAEISRSIEIKLSDYQKRMISDVGTAGNEELLKTYRDVSKSITVQSLQGSLIEDSPYQKEPDGTYRSFVLVKIDMAIFNQYLKSQVNSNEILKAKFEEKKLFEEANEEWEKYEAERAKGQ